MALIMPYKGMVPRIDAKAFVAPSAVVIGDVEIGAESSVWFNVTLRGDVNALRIGERSNVQDNTVFHGTSGGNGVVVGNDVTIGHGAVVHACTIEDRAFVGMGAILLDGVVIESEAMVAAGALVAPGKRVQRGELWAGNPARLLRKLSEREIEGFLERALHYAALANCYRQEVAR